MASYYAEFTNPKTGAADRIETIDGGFEGENYNCGYLRMKWELGNVFNAEIEFRQHENDDRDNDEMDIYANGKLVGVLT